MLRHWTIQITLAILSVRTKQSFHLEGIIVGGAITIERITQIKFPFFGNFNQINPVVKTNTQTLISLQKLNFNLVFILQWLECVCMCVINGPQEWVSRDLATYIFLLHRCSLQTFKDLTTDSAWRLRGRNYNTAKWSLSEHSEAEHNLWPLHPLWVTRGKGPEMRRLVSGSQSERDTFLHRSFYRLPCGLPWSPWILDIISFTKVHWCANWFGGLSCVSWRLMSSHLSWWETCYLNNRNENYEKKTPFVETFPLRAYTVYLT